MHSQAKISKAVPDSKSGETKPKAVQQTAAATRLPAWTANWQTPALFSPQELNYQAKLTISQPDEPYEQEADQVANQIDQAESDAILGLASPEEDADNLISDTDQIENITSPTEVMAKSIASSARHDQLQMGSDDLMPDIEGGQPLDATTRARLEPKFGYDFSRVRVHTDEQAAASAEHLNAYAYTTGRHIVFGAGQYSPQTPVGQRLLAHELTHVVQQGRQPVKALQRDAKSKAKTNTGIKIATIKIEKGDTNISVMSRALIERFKISREQARLFTVRMTISGTKLVQGRQVEVSLSKSEYDKIKSQITSASPGNNGTTGPGASPTPDTTQGGTIITPPSPDDKVPVVTVSDTSQIEQLKQRGLLPAESADKIKAKLDKQENLSFEEALALLDALNKFAPATPKPDDKKTDDKPAEDSAKEKESWLKWAKFIQENKDKLSGQVKGGGDGSLTVDQVKQILAKQKEYVGVKDAPPSASLKDKVYDPKRRKSWNALSEGQKKLITEYLQKYGEGPKTDAQDEDFKLDASLKLSMALHISPNYMQAGAMEAAKQLFNDPLFQAGIVVSITLYVGAWVFPEPIFSKGAAATITIAMLALFSVSEIKNFAFAWSDLSDGSSAAQTLDDIEGVAEKFGKAVGGIGIRVLITLATILAGKALPTPRPIVGGGGGGMATVGAGAGGGSSTIAAGAIRVLADGTVVIVGVGPGTGIIAQSVRSTGGSGGPPETVKPTEEKPAEQRARDEKAAEDKSKQGQSEEAKRTAQQKADVRFQELQGRGRNLSQAEAEELQRLRIQRGEPIEDVTPDTAAHKAQRWDDYKNARDNEGWSYDRWSKQYDTNMDNVKNGLAREQAYRTNLGGENKVIKTPLSNRQLDCVVGKKIYQIKTGYEYLSTSGKLPNTEAIAKDKFLISQGFQVEWVLEADGSAPLKAELVKAGIKITIGKLIP